MNQLQTWWQRKETLHMVTLAIAIVVGLLLFQRFNFRLVESFEDDAVVYLQQADSTRNALLLYTPGDAVTVNGKINTLKNQFAQIGFRKEHHLYLGRKFYSNYYSFSMVLIASSIISAIMLFFIALKGWAGTQSKLVKVLFFVFFFISTMYGVLSVVFNQEGNYQDNVRQYLQYDNLQSNIITYLKTLNYNDSNAIKPSLDTYIRQVDTLMRASSQLFIQIDAKKFSAEDIDQLLKKRMGQ